MRLLHTADWHVGKKLGRIDRDDEVRDVLAELVQIAADRRVDAVLVAGDLFDRGLPPFASLATVLNALVGLASTGARVVAIPGNHDSPDLFEVLAPHLRHSGVHLVHRPLAADKGGVVEVPARGGKHTARVACFPFLHQAYAVDFMDEHDQRHKSYADRVRAICRHYGEHASATAARDSIDVLMGHFMIHNAVPSGTERPLHIGEAYMAREDAVPHTFHYAALGHIHQAQPAPGSEDYARYCGSLMQLDFGEADQDKGVVVVDVDPDGSRHIEVVPVTSGRRLLKVTGTVDELRARAEELAGTVLSVEIVTDTPSPTLADEVHSFLPDALYVRVAAPKLADDFVPRADDMTLPDLYDAYHRRRWGEAPSEELRTAFAGLLEETGASL